MFGYVRPWRAELLVKEWEQYRGVYCGLCRRLGQVCGAASRLALSYDATFFAMLLLGLQGGCSGFERRRCVVNPAKKCNFCLAEGEALDLAAALTVILAWYKLKDDWQDGGFSRKARSALAFPLAAPAHRKALARYPRLEQLAEEYWQAQAEAERQGAGLDACAEHTAHMLEEALAFGASRLGAGEGDSLERILRQLGYHLGRWIYLMDAADDWREDGEKGSFNPFLLRFSSPPSPGSQEETQLRDYANQTLNMTMAQLNGAFSLLELRQFGPILRNIVEQGMPQAQRQTLFQEKKENDNVGSL